MVRPLSLALVMLLTLGACSDGGGAPSAPPTTRDPVVETGVLVGVVMAETGRWSEVEGPLIAAIRAEVDRRNTAGGAGGELIDLRVRDSGSTIEGAIDATRALFDNGARLLFVGCDSEVAGGAALIGQESALVVVSPCASSSTFGAAEIGDLVFTLGTANVEQGHALADLAFERSAGRVALVSEIAAPDSGEACRAFEQRHLELGGSIAADVLIGEGGTSVEPVGDALGAFGNLEAAVLCVAPPTLQMVSAQLIGRVPIALSPMMASAVAPLPAIEALAPASGVWSDLGTSAAEMVFATVDEVGGYKASALAEALADLADVPQATGPLTMTGDHTPTPRPVAVISPDGTITERPLPAAVDQ